MNSAVMKGTVLRAELRGPEGQPLSDGELRALRMYAQIGDFATVGLLLGLQTNTVKNQCQKAYAKLGVNSAVAAFHRLGWLQVPE